MSRSSLEVNLSIPKMWDLYRSTISDEYTSACMIYCNDYWPGRIAEVWWSLSSVIFRLDFALSCIAENKNKKEQLRILKSCSICIPYSSWSRYTSSFRQLYPRWWGAKFRSSEPPSIIWLYSWILGCFMSIKVTVNVWLSMSWISYNIFIARLTIASLELLL